MRQPETPTYPTGGTNRPPELPANSGLRGAYQRVWSKADAPAASADASTPLQAIFHGAPPAECLSADFKKRTLTFKLEGHHQPAGGAYFLVPQVVAQVSIDRERAESAHSAAFLPPGQLTSLHFRARNDLALLITGENGFEHTLYRRRPSVTDQYPEPDHWSGHLSRQDAEGNKWSRCSGSYVTDNFGELVQVRA